MKYLVRLVDAIRSIFKRKPKREIRHAAGKEYEYNRYRAENRAELDRLLDKINRHGKDSLTKNEREFLKKTSDF